MQNSCAGFTLGSVSECRFAVSIVAVVIPCFKVKAHILDVLEYEVIPAYYDKKGKWWEVVKTSIKDVLAFFESDRMADEYYKKLYDVQ